MRNLILTPKWFKFSENTWNMFKELKRHEQFLIFCFVLGLGSRLLRKKTYFNVRKNSFLLLPLLPWIQVWEVHFRRLLVHWELLWHDSTCHISPDTLRFCNYSVYVRPLGMRYSLCTDSVTITRKQFSSLGHLEVTMLYVLSLVRMNSFLGASSPCQTSKHRQTHTHTGCSF